ncbi:TetR/AcrR family transcriptional regulator [Saccharopolyspora phatthalungensis]|uniref:AcrR family transcriptional regulator n=1 Tax=Saccharopolyspora phatthalungensis TaxID=664693 RepID=A0A840QHK2_9PSEU|nr:TetR family transcriptional regulator [Saccharopolyspora phatthalungensis]MBB5160006.1 AcrR family transcriptional regulator [Saccharopolyspora phatthalungensis]
MAISRPRNAEATRADILSAARVRFGADGYERTTLRAIAADVGVNPALVIRYFGSKEDLFAAAADFTLDFPDLADIAPPDLAAVLLNRFLAVWERDSTFVALLRAAASSPTAAERMREVFATQVAPALAAATPDHPGQRAALMGAFMVGLATSRYILRTPGIAEMGHEDLTRWAGPIITNILTDTTQFSHLTGRGSAR